MMELPLGALRFAPDIAFAFPEGLCSNCGTTQGVQVRAQETTVVRYFLFAGTQVTLNLPVPACDGCSASLGRKPSSPFSKLLAFGVFFMAFSLAILIAVTVGEMTLPVLPEHPFLLGAILSAAFLAAVYALKRPRPGQSSYYQPVRLLRLKRAFASGVVEGMRLGFTSEAYRTAFARLNAPVLATKKVTAERA